MVSSPVVRWTTAAFSAGDPADVRVIHGRAANLPDARRDSADAAMALLLELFPVDGVPVFASVTVDAVGNVAAIGTVGDGLGDHQRLVDSWLELSRPTRTDWPAEG